MKVTILIFVVSLVAVSATSAGCPKGCSCKNSETEVKCHLPAARSIPQVRFPQNLTSLDLSGNNILNIPSGSLRSLTKLRNLNLDHNKIYFLENGAFKGSDLSTISLEDNNIHFIEEEVFSLLEKLEELNLMKNSLENLPDFGKNLNLRKLHLSYNRLQSLPPRALKDNVILEELHLESNDLIELPRDVFPEDVTNITVLNLAENGLRSTPVVVKELTGLEKLMLSYNPIKIFQSEDFRPLTALKMLTLTDVGMKEFPENVFWLPNLEYLDLGKNQISGNSLPNIRFPSLTTLILKDNKVGVIGSSSFLSVEKLEVLIASSCEISVIHERAFMTLLRLKKLDLRDNKLTSLPVLQENRELEEIVLDGNSIQTLNFESFKTLANLKTLSIANNSLSRLLPPINPTKLPLTVINLSGNKFNVLPSFSLLPNLTLIDMSRNSLEGELRTSLLKNLKELIILNLKGNGFTRLVSDSVSPLALENLYLCGNNLTNLENDSLASFPKLTEFTADRNSINELGFATFSDNPVLKKISLASNNLRDIDDRTFANLKELSELRLVYNNLTKTPNIAANHKLKNLGLCNNPIGNLPPGSLKGPRALEIVLLRGMGMTSLKSDVFGNIKGIRHLNLALDNGFTRVPTIIQNMTSLRTLKLSGNPITHFSASDFEGLNNLRELRLDNMLVKSTDVTELFPALPALRSLRLSGNPWQCDCNVQLYALGIDGARARIVTDDRSKMRCSGPGRLRNKSFDYLRLGNFRHCKESKMLKVGEDSAVISLPNIAGLSQSGETLNRISYMPLPGREESVLWADKNEKVLKISNLFPETTYLVCVSTETSPPKTRESMMHGTKSRKPATDSEGSIVSAESCLKFKTLSSSLKTPWAKGGFGNSSERSRYLLIIYAILGGTLGVVLLLSAGAVILWCRRRRKSFSERPTALEKRSTTNGLNGGSAETEDEDTNTTSRGRGWQQRKTTKEEENGEVLEMSRETISGHDNLACDVPTVAQRTKL